MREKHNVFAEMDLVQARERQVRQTLDVMNRLLASDARPQSVAMLRRILQARAEARVKRGGDQNSLPGLF